MLRTLFFYLRLFFSVRSATEDTDLVDFAKLSYDYCVSWFGEPSDAEKSYTLSYGLFSLCQLDRSGKEYIIMIEAACRKDLARFGEVAHEMCHRVLYGRTGLCQEVWIDEMLATLTAQKVMDEQSYDYRERLLEWYDAKTHWMTVAELKRVQPVVSLHEVGDRNSFYTGVTKLGRSLEALISWEDICRLVHCATWEEWLAPFEADKRVAVSQLLELNL